MSGALINSETTVAKYKRELGSGYRTTTTTESFEGGVSVVSYILRGRRLEGDMIRVTVATRWGFVSANCTAIRLEDYGISEQWKLVSCVTSAPHAQS